MPIDVSMYNTQQVNPFAQANSIADLRLKMNQNQLFQQEYTSKLAVGDVARRSIDPKTGQIDYGKFAQGISLDPRTAYLAPQILGQIATNNKTAADTMGTQLDNAHKRMAAMSEVAGSLARKPGEPVTDKDIVDAFAGLRTNYPGLFDDKEQMSFATSIPQDPLQRGQFFSRIAQQSEGGRAALEKSLGTIKEITSAGGTSIVQASPTTGQVSQLGTVSPGVSPEFAGSSQTFTGPNGEQRTGTRQSVLGVQPQAPVLNPFVQGPQTLVPPQAQTPMQPQPGGPSSQSLPQTPISPASQAQAPAQAAPQGVQTGLSPLEQKQQEAVGDIYKGINDATYEARVAKQQLEEVNNALGPWDEKTGKFKNFSPGGGKAWRAQIAQVFQAFGANDATTKAIAGGDLSAAQIFDKLMTTNSMQVLRQAIGGQGRLTNLEFEKFLQSNPNLDTDPRAVKKMLDYFNRMANLPFVEQQAFQKYQEASKANPARYPMTNFPVEFNKYLAKKGWNVQEPAQ